MLTDLSKWSPELVKDLRVMLWGTAADMPADGWPAQGQRTMLDDLGKVTGNRIVSRLSGTSPFDATTTPTPLRQKAFEFLGVRP